MLSLKDLYERRKETSAQVGAQTRTSGLGLLAISWALLTAHDQPLQAMTKRVPETVLLGIGIFGVLTVTFDLLQYVSATKAADRAIETAKKSESKEAQYDDQWFSWRAIAWMYHGKFIALSCGATLLLAAVILMFVRK